MERRNDPYDGKTQTLQEMLQKYKGIYSKGEIETYFKDECAAVPKMTASACSAEIPGLRQWLKEIGWEGQWDQVVRWCEENGAVLLEEVQENWHDIEHELQVDHADAPEVHDSGAGIVGKISGLEEWLEEKDLEGYLEDVMEWCEQNKVKTLKEIESKWEIILQDLKLKTAKAELPGQKVSVQVLVGKWQGTYIAKVLNVTDAGIRIKHLEDDFEETLPLEALGGDKYRLLPVDSEDEESDTVVLDSLRKGYLSVEIGSGAGLELRWVKLGYAVDQVDRRPGQKDLHAGDVILWINGMFLLGFDEDTVTERFTQAFANGAPMVIGKLSILMKHSLKEVEEAVKELIWTREVWYFKWKKPLWRTSQMYSYLKATLACDL